MKNNSRQIFYSHFNITPVIFIALLLFSCRSINVENYPVTAADREKTENFNVNDIANSVNRVVLISPAECPATPHQQDLLLGITYDISSKMKGVQVVDRNHLNHILNELSLSQTGLFDEKTAVKIGQLLSAQYIVLPCLVNFGMVNQYKKRPFATASVSITIIEISTAKIIYSRTISDKSSSVFPAKMSGNKQTLESFFLPEIIKNCLNGIRQNIQERFPMRSMIIAMRGDKKFVMLPVGLADNIKPGTEFSIMKKEIQNTIIGKVPYEIRTGKIRIIHSDEHSSWGKTSGNPENIKIGMVAVME